MTAIDAFLSSIKVLWEATLTEVVIGFPDEPPSFWLQKARELFVQRLGLLFEESEMRPPVCSEAASR